MLPSLFRRIRVAPLSRSHVQSFRALPNAASPVTLFSQGVALRSALLSTGAVMDELMNKAQHNRISKILQEDTRVRMPVSEFYGICKENGVDQAEADKLSKSLHDCGLALRFSTAPLSDMIILKPDHLTVEFMKLLDHDGKYTEEFVKEKRAELAKARARLAELSEEKKGLDALAYKRADRLLGLGAFYLIAQGAVVARLTWWELSWDIMEPITYLITFSTSIITILYFSTTKTEFTYDSLREHLAVKRMEKIYRKRSFEIDEWSKLNVKVAQLEKELETPEVHLLRSLGKSYERDDETLPRASGV